MKNITNHIIGKIVADDYRTAAIFNKYGIDFCCQGNRTVQEACEQKAIDMKAVLVDLVSIQEKAGDQNPDYNTWPLERLVDHILAKHHTYVEEALGQLKPYLDKICQVHGKQHPELFKIKGLFYKSSGELAMHMKKEEFVLFPFIRKLVKAHQNNEPVSNPHFGTVQNPIEKMMEEHDTEGERFREISVLTDQYTPPADACNTYRVTYALLKEFEEDLHLHIHLENNILFPKSLELEKGI